MTYRFPIVAEAVKFEPVMANNLKLALGVTTHLMPEVTD